MLGSSDRGDPESGGSTSDLRLARCSNYSGSGKALRVTSWRHRTGAYRGSVHSDWLCRSLPGQFGIPKLMLRTLEPFGSSSGTASSLPSRLALLSLSFLHTPERIYSWPPWSSPILPLAAAYLSRWRILPREVPSGPTAFPAPWHFHRLMELGSWKGPQRSCPTPSFDR